jgi:hypothetical protein
MRTLDPVSVAKFASASAAGLALAWFGRDQLQREVRAEVLRLPGTNQEFIDGLYSDLDLESAPAVFRYILERLPSKVVVYPSEGYYYFSFPMRGVSVKGTILFSVRTRDRGVLEFGYVGEIEDHPHDEYMRTPGRSFEFGPEQGLVLTREDGYHYRVEYEGISVLFELFDPGHVAPSHLQPEEEYVATSMDESGLRFDLLFHQRTQRLFWTLDESGFVPESFLAVGEHLVQGARTKFMFLRDPVVRRKVLIGVHGREIHYNSWCDGPFDQLPDTRVALGELDMREYIVAHTGLAPEVMDRFGGIVAQSGVRVPVAPYRIYSELEEFDFVEAFFETEPEHAELLAKLAANAHGQ